MISFLNRLYKKIKVELNTFIYKMEYNKNLNIGKSVYFQKGFSLVIDGQDTNVTIGNNVFFNCYCSINAKQNIIIGENSIFGENVKIYDHNHIYNNPNVPISEQGFTTDDVKIGKNCWIGSNVIILKGTVIGDHSVIGAGSVVYKDVPSNTVLISKQDQLLKQIKD